MKKKKRTYMKIRQIMINEKLYVKKKKKKI